MPEELSRPIAVVIPWFGRGLKGGAERHAWEVAARLAGRGLAVEVLTTCCRAHHEDWATNHEPSGLTHEPEGFAVRRFRVEPRNREALDSVNRKLMGIPKKSLKRGVSPIDSREEAIFCDELIRSPDLLEHLKTQGGEYRAFFFIPYLYFTTLRGLPLVAGKSILVPCLHHESYAFLNCVSGAFFQARKILFNSEGEFRLASWLFGPGVTVKGTVAGEGVEFQDAIPPDGSVDVSALRPFVLCLGRQGPGKNTDFLAASYAAYRTRVPGTKLKLVLAGPGNTALPARSDGIVNLGMVSESAKHELLGGCEALFNPSINESYSRVIMEAWHSCRPVAVHRDCLATATAVSHGENGWIAGDQDEWTSIFEKIEQSSSEELAELGRHGRTRADEMADWTRSISKYETAIRELECPFPSSEPNHDAQIHQVLPNLAVGDAISNEAISIRRFLRNEGYLSDIYALHVDPRLETEAKQWQPGCLTPQSSIIYHHSIGTVLTGQVCEHPGPKAVLYHNITPHHFLKEYLPLNSILCKEARDQLPGLARFFPISAGASVYNAIELSECGFSEPGVLPLCVDPAKWATPPDRTVMEKQQDGRTNILFVGRLSPNKRQEDLIVAFSHYLRLEPTARLNLVGTAASPDDLYERRLRRLAEDLGLSELINFTGAITEAELAAYYLTANLFWSMSEHEGFCVPLIEAMWFDVPVMAYAACAVPETLAGSGNLFSSKDDANMLARQAFNLAHNLYLREAVLVRQRIRRQDFLPHRIEPHLRRLVAKLEAGKKPTAPKDPPPAILEQIRAIAVVKLDHIGDLLLATPVFFSLAMRFPGARITAIVSPQAAPILAGNPYVSRVVTYDPPWFLRTLGNEEAPRSIMARNRDAMEILTSEPFDLVVNLRSDHQNVLFAASLPHRHMASYTNDSAFAFLITHPLTRTRSMHITRQHRELLRSIGADFWCEPSIYFSNDDLSRAVSLAAPDAMTVVMAAGAGVPLKRWAAVKFRELARRLRGRGLRVVIVGKVSDSRLCDDWSREYGCLDLCGKLSLTELAALLSRAGCLVANDSAAMHIGAAVKTPVVYIMRPSVREEFAPVGSGHRGCVATHCQNPCKGFDPEDRDGAPEFCHCVQSVTVDEVERAVLDTLAQRPGPG